MIPIYFKLSQMQANELEQYMQQEGYTSKAEFFRYLLKFYKMHTISLDQYCSRELAELRRLAGDAKSKGVSTDNLAMALHHALHTDKALAQASAKPDKK